MARAISVVLAVLVLLGVGWYVGRRPLARVERLAIEEKRAVEETATALKARTADAEARAQLWAARGELLEAALDVRDGDFAGAAAHAGRGRDLITRALALPGFTIEAGPVRDMAEAALTRIQARDPEVAQALRRAGDEIFRLLDQGGRA